MIKNKISYKKSISHIILVIWCSSIFMFFYWIIIASLKTNKTVFRNLWSLPEILNIINYKKAWSTLSFDRYTFNSLIVVGSAVILILLISAPASYALTRLKIKFANPITMFYIAGMGIPMQLLIIPLFRILNNFNLVDTLIGLIIAYVTVSLPFTVFLLTGFFLTIPKELAEAGYVDGCSELRVFIKIIIPVATPGFVTAAIFNFINLWQDYFLALIFITSDKNKTLSLGLYSLQTRLLYSSDWVTMFAGSFIVIIPTVILYVLLSEKFISGITTGALK